MKRIFKIILFIVVTPISLFLIFLAYSSFTDYTPLGNEVIKKNKGRVIDIRDTLTIFNWNIGYAGLNKEMSFFYDGGNQVRTTFEQTKQNLNSIIQQIAANDSADFYLLQEVDVNSKRSYYTNQLDSISKLLSTYKSYFAYNYKVDFVPIPPTEPLGKTRSGLLSLSKIEPFLVKRHAFEGNYSWPTSLFMLDRCFMVKRFYTSNGKEFLLVNTHNSAYDNGDLRKKQMEMLRNFLIKEYKNGNYVLVGGDWNQMPPKMGEAAKEYSDEHLTRVQIAADFMPEGWEWIYSDSLLTNRMLNRPYHPDSTITSVIDFFLVSPNIKALAFTQICLNFENSDHEPMVMNFKFK